MVKEYQDSSDDLAFFSTLAPGHFDLRLVKDGNEIIWGLGTNEDGSVHPPTLAWPKIFGRKASDVDRAFEVFTNEEILNMAEQYFKIEKKAKNMDDAIEQFKNIVWVGIISADNDEFGLSEEDKQEIMARRKAEHSWEYILEPIKDDKQRNMLIELFKNHI